MAPKNIFPEKLPLFLILAVSSLLTLWGLLWGLPLKKAHIDEAVVVFYSLRFLTGDLNPHVFFDYPTLYPYMLGTLYFAYFLIGKLFGIFQNMDSFIGIYLSGNASAFYIIGRLLSAAFGTGSVYLVYRLGKENFAGGGLLPALAMALIPISVLYGHYAMVDTTCVFFLLASFLFFSRHFKDGKTPDLYKGSFLMGLGIAAKYYPAVFFIPVLVYLLAVKKYHRALASAGLVLAGFIAGCPFALIDFQAFYSRFADRFNYIVWGPAGGGSVPSANLIIFVKTFADVFKPALLLLLIAGIVFYILKNRNTGKLLLWIICPALYIAFLLTWKIVSPHYFLPVIPFLLLAGISGLDSDKYGRIIRTAIIIACLFPAYQSVKTDILLSKEDTRLTALKWMRTNIEPGSNILRMPNTPEFTVTDPYIVMVDWEGKLAGAPAEKISSEFEYVLTSRFSNGPAPEWENSLLKYFAIEKEWEWIPLAPFHHPRITLYRKHKKGPADER
ncbi:MAG: glycosyltransferase family 39 protein [Elusimicrobiota bacterium]